MKNRKKGKNERLPKYLMVADTLRSDISNGLEVGDRLASEEAMAKRFNISYLTIRQAVKVLIDEGWVERRHGSGTFVTDRKVRCPVALLCELNPENPSSRFVFTILKRLRELVQKAGGRSLVYFGDVPSGRESSTEGYEQFLDDLETGRLRGVLSISARREHAGWVKRAKELGLPVVGITGCKDFSWRVLTDHMRMLKEGIEFLIRNERRRVACIGWDEPGAKGMTTREVCEKTLTKHGIKIRNSWLKFDLEPGVPGLTSDYMSKLWSGTGEKPDGLLICDDNFFGDAYLALAMQQVSVPDDCLVVTHANRGMHIAGMRDVIRMEIDLEFAAERAFQMFLEQERDGHETSPHEELVSFDWVLPDRWFDGLEIRKEGTTSRVNA